jgi:M6 family metalloprotease-like protein
MLVNGVLVSSGYPVDGPPPVGVPRHLRESISVRNRRFEGRRLRTRPLRLRTANDAALTFGPSQGLLEGRRLSIGAVRGLTLIIEFQDVRTTVTKPDVDDLLTGQNYTRNGNVCSVQEYFQRVSTGKLNYTCDVVGPLRLSQDRSYYVTHLLVKEALDLAVAEGVDLRRYDSLGEGIVDALNIVYAGQTQYVGELWPHNSFVDLRYDSIAVNLYMLTSAGRSASDLSIGTFCHESGHLLCRFPDMYDYGAVNREGDGVKSAGIGCYCLMGSGNHLNFGRSPSPVCAYLRDLAEWCEEIVLNSIEGVEVQHAAYDKVLKFKTSAPNEYFIVENRSKLGLDQHLPSSGLAVYHCDILGSNEFQEGTGLRHYQCALLQADGHTDLEHNVNQGDGTDLFGGMSGVALSNATSPSTRLWNGSDSGLAISNVSVPGSKMDFRVGTVPSGVSIQVENGTAVQIPDNMLSGIESKINIPSGGVVKQLRVALDITHTYIGDLIVDLTGPDGTTVRLHDRAGAGTDNLMRSYDPASLAELAEFEGKGVKGDWVLAVRDVAGQDKGKLNRWGLDIVAEGVEQVIGGEAAPDIQIPDNSPAGVSSSITIGRGGTVARITVSVDITHTYIGDLRIEVLSPGGRGVLLHGQLGDDQDNLVVTYDSGAPLSPLSALVGQSIQGSWILRVADVARVDVGTLNKWSVEIVPS